MSSTHLADFLLNSSTALDQGTGGADIAALPTGGFMVLWSTTESAAVGAPLDIMGRVFKSDVTPVFTDFLVNPVTAGIQTAPQLVALKGGTLVAGWNSLPGTIPATYSSEGEILNTSGSSVGNTFVLNTGADDRISDMTLLKDGHYVVALQDPINLGTKGYQTKEIVQIHNASGPATSAVILVKKGQVTQPMGTMKVAGLTNGGFAAVWYEADPQNTSATTVFAHAYDHNGKSLGPQIKVTAPNSDSHLGANVAGLAGGRFVVTWHENKAFGMADVHARIYEANGSAVGKDFIVNNHVAGNQSSPAVTETADGRILFAWNTDAKTSGDFDIQGRLFNADGTPADGDFRINSTTVGSQSNVHLALLKDGRIAVEWGSFDKASGTGWDIRGTIIDPSHMQGSGAADKLFGGTKSDTINGLGGNDRITGGKGADILTGGPGNDKFVYNFSSEGTDQITDFAKGDHFEFYGKNFGGLAAGPLAAAAFRTNATGDAQDLSDRFIFNASDHSLCFDSNGSASGGTHVMMAHLSNNYTLGAQDILIV